MAIVDPRASSRLDWTFKGIPPDWQGLTVDAAVRKPLSLFDDRLLLPVAILKRDVMEANSRWMRRFLESTGIRIAPHGKSTMAPELFRLQEADGAWGFTAATPSHVRSYREFGVRRVFLANQLIGQGAIEWIVDMLAQDAGFDFYCLVDSPEGVRLLESVCEARRAARPIQVLVEVGRAGGRAGVRTLEQGLEVARAAAAARQVNLVGISTFEGVVPLDAAGAQNAGPMIEDVGALAVACDRENLFASRIILSGGGSGFFDLVAKLLPKLPLSRKPEVIIRSGCYLTQDDGLYQRLFAELRSRSSAATELGEGLQSALEVWAHVQSIPESGRMICTLGKRDVGADVEPPVLKSWCRRGERAVRACPAGFRVVAMNDQHTYVDGPAAGHFQIGDLVGFGVSHPCTTFDKWRGMMVVDEDYRIVDFVRTYF